jgi:DNA-binding response OmpR family regulator
MSKGSRDLGSSIRCGEMSRPSDQRGIVKEGQRILVVEPNDLILGLLERWLGDADYEVSVAPSLTRLKGRGESPPHLVIIDVPTPRTAQKMISSVREVFSSPILLLSGTFRRGTSSSGYARQLGVHKMLPKPFTREELLSAVSESIDTVN